MNIIEQMIVLNLLGSKLYKMSPQYLLPESKEVTKDCLGSYQNDTKVNFLQASSSQIWNKLTIQSKTIATN